MRVTEKKLFWRTLFSALLLLVSVVSLSVPWGHWAYTLNTCPDYDCGCILYGTAYANEFAGGPVEYCRFVVFVQIPIFLISAVLSCYHGYRVFIKQGKAQKRAALLNNPLLTARTRSRKEEQLSHTAVLVEPDPPSFKMAVFLGINALIMIVCLLTAVVITTDGFYTSCNQYRKTLVTSIGSSANVADAIKNRMQCISVFDFLDYLQPDRFRPNQPPSLQYMRKDRINTGISLLVGKSALIMNTVNWVFLAVFHFKRLNSYDKCCKCCSKS